MSCVINLWSQQERFDSARDRRNNARKQLMADIREVNNTLVHPLSVNYATDEWTAQRLFVWASYQGLLTDADKATYFNW